MESNYEITQKSEVVLEGENLEVVERVRIIKSLMDAVIGSSIIETTNDILESFNGLLNGDFNFLERWLHEMYPLFSFRLENFKLIANARHIHNCISFPSFITNLDIRWCKGLTSLEGLPEGLNSLAIYECENLTSLEGLPESIKRLEIANCEGLKGLEGLPDGLESFEVTSCFGLTSLEGLPDGLEIFEVTSCFGLTSLERLPSSLKSLGILYCYGLTSLEGLPEGLESLKISECSRKNLDEESLKMLDKFGV